MASNKQEMMNRGSAWDKKGIKNTNPVVRGIMNVSPMADRKVWPKTKSHDRTTDEGRDNDLCPGDRLIGRK